MMRRTAMMWLGWPALALVLVSVSSDGQAATGAGHLWFDDLTNTTSGAVYRATGNGGGNSEVCGGTGLPSCSGNGDGSNPGLGQGQSQGQGDGVDNPNNSGH